MCHHRRTGQSISNGSHTQQNKCFFVGRHFKPETSVVTWIKNIGDGFLRFQRETTIPHRMSFKVNQSLLGVRPPKLQQSSGGERRGAGREGGRERGGGQVCNMVYGAKMLPPSGSSASDCERHCQTNCRARWAHRLAALDRVGAKCVAFDSKVLDLCRFESIASCLML